MGFMMARMDKKDLVYLRELLESGKVLPVIDRCYPLSDVAEALRYLEAGHARGKVIINMWRAAVTSKANPTPSRIAYHDAHADGDAVGSLYASRSRA